MLLKNKVLYPSIAGFRDCRALRFRVCSQDAELFAVLRGRSSVKVHPKQLYSPCLGSSKNGSYFRHPDFERPAQSFLGNVVWDSHVSVRQETSPPLCVSKIFLITPRALNPVDFAALSRPCSRQKHFPNLSYLPGRTPQGKIPYELQKILLCKGFEIIIQEPIRGIMLSLA